MSRMLFFKILRKEESKTYLWVQRKIQWSVRKTSYTIRAKKNLSCRYSDELLSWSMIFLTFQAFLRGSGSKSLSLKSSLVLTVAVIRKRLTHWGLGNWGTLEVGWVAGFLMTGLSKSRRLPQDSAFTSWYLSSVLYLDCSSWVTLKKKAPLPASEVEKPPEKGLHNVCLIEGSFQIFWATFRLEALRGFNLKESSFTSFFTWVAKLQLPLPIW